MVITVRIVLLFLSFFSITSAWSKTDISSASLSDSLVCLDATRKIESEYNIPPHILSAIALTETGRSSTITNSKVFTPWPWTTNIRGKGFYFKSKQELLNKLTTTLNSGEKLFDVGCMQVNWYYHGEAFTSLEQALNPYENVRYAAEFLISLYEKTKSWPKAVERYHSATPVHFQRYRRLVANNWDKARDLMSSIDGSLYHYFLNNKNQAQFLRYTPPVANPKLSKAMSFKIARMREIAKLRARVRLYAQNTY